MHLKAALFGQPVAPNEQGRGRGVERGVQGRNILDAHAYSTSLRSARMSEASCFKASGSEES